MKIYKMPRVSAKREIWFVGCEHYGHERIALKRGFSSRHHQDNHIMLNHNRVVSPRDYVVHLGDTFLCKPERAEQLLNMLNGHHIMIEGDHDRILFQTQNKKKGGGLLFDMRPPIFRISIDGQEVVACHWCMRTWPRSHYNSWHIHAHHHGHDFKLGHFGKSYEVSVENTNFYPTSFATLAKIMDEKPDNENYLKPEDRKK